MGKLKDTAHSLYLIWMLRGTSPYALLRNLDDVHTLVASTNGGNKVRLVHVIIDILTTAPQHTIDFTDEAIGQLGTRLQGMKPDHFSILTWKIHLCLAGCSATSPRKKRFP